MNARSINLLICFLFSISLHQAQASQTSIAAMPLTTVNKLGSAGRSKNVTSSLHAKLLNDLSRTDYVNVAKEWNDVYDQIDVRFRNTVHTSNGKYKMAYGDAYGLNKGFYWQLCGEYINTGAPYGLEETDSQVLEYRLGMVYFYVKYQVLKCE